MKILTLVWSIGMGGTERAAVNYAIGYKKFGQDSRVMVLGKGHQRYSDLMEANVDTVLVEISHLSFCAIAAEFKEWGPDIIHVHNFNKSFLDCIGRIRGPQTKVVDTNVFSRPYFGVDSKMVNLSMQLSYWGYWKYTRWMRRAKYIPPAAVIPYIVDKKNFFRPRISDIKDFLSAYNIPANAFVIGRLGQPHPSKWDPKIIKVIRKTICTQNNIYYLFVGLPDNLKKLIDKESDLFKQRVIQIEKIEGDQNLALYYYSLDCFAHISKIGESFGYVLAEALLCEIPVVSLLTPLNDNAQFEVIGSNFGGFCVTGINKFVEKIFLLYHNSEIKEVIKSNLKGWIEGKYSYDKVTPMQLQLYSQLLRGKKIPEMKVDDIVNANFDLFRKRISLMPWMSKCINSSIFYRLNQFIRTIAKK